MAVMFICLALLFASLCTSDASTIPAKGQRKACEALAEENWPAGCEFGTRLVPDPANPDCMICECRPETYEYGVCEDKMCNCTFTALQENWCPPKSGRGQRLDWTMPTWTMPTWTMPTWPPTNNPPDFAEKCPTSCGTCKDGKLSESKEDEDVNAFGFDSETICEDPTCPDSCGDLGLILVPGISNPECLTCECGEPKIHLKADHEECEDIKEDCPGLNMDWCKMTEEFRTNCRKSCGLC